MRVSREQRRSAWSSAPNFLILVEGDGQTTRQAPPRPPTTRQLWDRETAHQSVGRASVPLSVPASLRANPSPGGDRNSSLAEYAIAVPKFCHSGRPSWLALGRVVLRPHWNVRQPRVSMCMGRANTCHGYRAECLKLARTAYTPMPVKLYLKWRLVGLRWRTRLKNAKPNSSGFDPRRSLSQPPIFLLRNGRLLVQSSHCFGLEERLKRVEGGPRPSEWRSS